MSKEPIYPPSFQNVQEGKMSKILLGACAGIFFVFCAVAHATDVNGLISASTVWNTAGSPYVVTGNILVDTLVTLTIQPGVEVRLDSAKAIMVKGTLNAIGTVTDSIIITKNGTEDWARLWFKNASIESFKYCRIEYANSSAIYNENADPFCTLYIGYCIISNNSGGGGIYNVGKATITNNTISNNSSGYYGGGIMNSGLAVITNNTISYNVGNAEGGGICSFHGNGGDSVIISGNTISHNEAQFYTGNPSGGAGICCGGGNVIISNNIITYNSAGSNLYCGGGGIACGDGSITITNNTISNNLTYYGGGGIACGGGLVTITNNTFSYNLASYGSAIYGGTSTIIRYNTITDSTSYAIDLSIGGFIRTNNIFTTGHAVYNGATSDIDARYNYWNSVNTDTINAWIFDYFDDFSKGIVYYKPFLNKAFSDTAAPVAPLNLTAATNSDSTFVITWTNPSDPSGISEYYYKTGSAPVSDFDTTGRFHAAPDTLRAAEGMLYVWLVDSSGNLNYQNRDSVMLSLAETGIRGRNNNADSHLSFSVISDRSPTGHTLQYNLPEKAQVSLVLFDISGKLVKTMYSGMRDRGCYTQTLQGSELSAGMYYVKFKAGTFTSAKRLAVLR